MLNFTISYVDEPLPDDFNYEEKHEKLKQFPGITIKLTGFAKKNMFSLKTYKE
jgi:hypothetical protein